jgi:hypothetical protein
MITIIRRKSKLTYNQFWFARKPRGGWGFTSLLQFIGEKQPGFPFFKKPQYTLLIDLTQDDETLQTGMSKNMRSQLRKAENDGFVWARSDDLDEFRALYNAFAADKGLKPLAQKILDAEKHALYVAKTSFEGKPLVAHAYLVDLEESRARFLYGATVRLAEGADVNLVGRANRLAHWREMQEFRLQGLKTFDFGGYALNTEDAQKQGINQFKESFGGRIAEENTFDSFWFAILRPLKSVAAKFLKRRG